MVSSWDVRRGRHLEENVIQLEVVSTRRDEEENVPRKEDEGLVSSSASTVV